jgi:hypothetical protein
VRAVRPTQGRTSDRIQKKIISVEGEFKKVPLDPRVPDKTVCIDVEASQEE